MQDHDKSVCPYCALLLFAGRGIKNTVAEAAKDGESKEQLIMKVAIFLSPAIEALSKLCEKHRGLDKENSKNLN